MYFDVHGLHLFLGPDTQSVHVPFLVCESMMTADDRFDVSIANHTLAFATDSGMFHQ